MKTIFTLLFVTVFTSAFAYDEGKLTITVASQKNLQVYVDGRMYQADDNNFVLNNIQPGNHTIKIYKKSKKNTNSYGNNRNSRNERNDINKNNLIYSSTVYVKPSYHVDVMINRFGKVMVDEKVLSERNKNWDEDEWNDGNGNNNGSGYNPAMSEYDFNQFLQKIRNQWLGKMTTAKDGVNNNHFNVYQVKQILQLFSSESDKLELVKLSYKNLVDKQNFRQVYELFSYQSQTELDRYVRDFRY